MNKKNIIIACLALIILILTIMMWQDSNRNKEAVLDSNNSNSSIIERPIQNNGDSNLNPKPTSPTDSTEGESLEKSIVGMTWNLGGIEANGKDVDMSAKVAKPITIQFNTTDKTYTGFGGCNNFGGKYEFTPLDKITFEPALSTQMYCQGGASEFEQTFHSILQKVDTVGFKGGGLLLFEDQSDYVGIEPTDNMLKFSPSK